MRTDSKILPSSETDSDEASFDESVSDDFLTAGRDKAHIKKVIEAILFAAGHPVSYNKISTVTDIPAYTVKKIVAEMQDTYDANDGAFHGGIILLMYKNECQLCTRADFDPHIREALGIKKGGNLSASSLEVLAVVAYNEPVTRSFVDTVRGVDSAYAVGRLADRGLIESCGRLDAPGRPLLYRTTHVFLRCFGLNSINDLPNLDIPSFKMSEQEIAAETVSEVTEIAGEPEAADSKTEINEE